MGKEVSITYRYRRVGAYPWPVAGPVLPQHLSKYHIISYPFIKTFAVVTFWYIAQADQSSSTTIKIKNGVDNFYRTVMQVGGAGVTWPRIYQHFNKENLEEAVMNNDGMLNWICWAKRNLFIGPAAEYRKDDPSQKMAQIPIYMDDDVKKKVKNVMLKWQDVSRSRIVGRDGQMISIRIKLDKLPVFLETFMDYINDSEQIYRTRYDEWAVWKETERDTKKTSIFTVDFAKKPSKLGDEQHYKFLLREKAIGRWDEGSFVCINSIGNHHVTGIPVSGIEKVQREIRF